METEFTETLSKTSQDAIKSRTDLEAQLDGSRRSNQLLSEQLAIQTDALNQTRRDYQAATARISTLDRLYQAETAKSAQLHSLLMDAEQSIQRDRTC